MEQKEEEQKQQKEEEQQEQKKEEQQYQQAEPVLFSLSALRDCSQSSPALHCHRLSSVVPFARDLAGRFPSCAFHFHLAPDTTLGAIRDLEAAVRPRRVEFTKYTFNAIVEEGSEELKEEEIELQVGGKTGGATGSVGSSAQSDGGLANDNAAPNQIPARGTGEELIGVTVLGSKERGKGRIEAFISPAAESSSTPKRSSRTSKANTPPPQKRQMQMPKNEAKRPLIEAFNTEVWPLLVAKGWRAQPAKTLNKFFFFPPGVTTGKCRVDYFDSKKQVIENLKKCKEYKADLKEISSLRIKTWEDEALGAKYRVHFQMGGTVDISPVELRRDYNLVWGDVSPVLLPVTRAASKDGRRTPTKKKGRKRKRAATQDDDDLLHPTIPSNLEWAVVFMRFATLWEHGKPELVVATSASLGASKVETCLSTLRTSMGDKHRKKKAEIGIFYWESDEQFCANSCSLSGPGHWHSDGRLVAWQPGITRQILRSHDHYYVDHVSQRLQLTKTDGFGAGSDEMILDGFLRCAGILEVGRPLLKPIADELKCEEMNGDEEKIEKVVNSDGGGGTERMDGDDDRRITCKVKYVNIFEDVMEEVTPSAIHLCCKAKRTKGVGKETKICALCLDDIKNKDRLQLECRVCKSCFHGWCLRNPPVSKGFDASKQDLVKRRHGNSFLCPWCQANGKTSEGASQMTAARRAVDHMTALRGAYLRFACSADAIV